MRNFNGIFTGLLAAGMLLVSCDKAPLPGNTNNPQELSLPAAPFTVKVFVSEQGIDKDSLYIYESAEVKSDCPDGMVTFTSVTGTHALTGKIAKTFSIEPDVVELALTPWNSIRFETSAQVNVKSTTIAADVKAEDSSNRSFILKSRVDTDNPRDIKAFGSAVLMPNLRSDAVKAITEGETDIVFYNGPEGESRRSITIRVRTANHIPVEGFEVAVDGKRFTLVEYPKETTYSKLGEDAVICRLPNIAKPAEEWYVNGKKNTTEEKFNPKDFSTIEFIGTIPRNATPDNRLTQVIDVLSFRSVGTNEENNDAFLWSEKNYGEFRWMPYRKEVQSDFGQAIASGLAGKRAYKLYPSDVRYRKSKIWNYHIKETTERYNEGDFYFDYSVAPDPNNEKDVKFYWGKIFLELAKK